MELKLLGIEQIKNIYCELMINDFASNEVKPLDKILIMVKENRYFCYGVYDNEDFVGYAFVVKCNSYYMLDYYAILKSKRGQGLGSVALKLVKEKLEDVADVLIIESENPKFAEGEHEELVQKSRIDFYRKNGCIDTGVTTCAFFAEYVVFTLINRFESIDVKDVYSKIYLSMLDSETYDRFIVIH